MGRPVTLGRSSIGIGVGGGSSSLTFPRVAFVMLSVVERLLIGRCGSELSRLSVLPWTERGGVRGEGRCWRSVGRSAAGTYMGDFDARSWRFASGRLKVLLGDVGERFAGD